MTRAKSSIDKLGGALETRYGIQTGNGPGAAERLIKKLNRLLAKGAEIQVARVRQTKDSLSITSVRPIRTSQASWLTDAAVQSIARSLHRGKDVIASLWHRNGTHITLHRPANRRNFRR